MLAIVMLFYVVGRVAVLLKTAYSSLSRQPSILLNEGGTRSHLYPSYCNLQLFRQKNVPNSV